MTVLLEGSTRTGRPARAEPTGSAAAAPSRPPILVLLAAAASVAMAAAGLAVAATDGPLAIELVRPAVVVLWAAAAAILALHRRRERLCVIVVTCAVIGGAGTWAAAAERHVSLTGGASLLADAVVRLSMALLPAVALHLLVALPDGCLTKPSQRLAVIGGYVSGAAVGLALLLDRSNLIAWPLIVLWVVDLAVGFSLSHDRYRSAGAVDRRRLQWFGWGVAVATEAALVRGRPAGAFGLARARGRGGARPHRPRCRSPSSPAPCPSWWPASTASSPTPSPSPGSPRWSSPSTSSSCSALAAPRPATNGPCCCCRWERPASPRSSTCRPGAG